MKDLYLIYVHQSGKDYKHKYTYQFIFSDTLKDINGDGWESYPASGNPEPPNDSLIKQVGEISGDLRLTLIQENEQFSMWDAIDNVVALAWEDIDNLEEYPEERLTFSFGMKSEDVKSLLYSRDIILEYEKQIKNE